MKRTVQSLFLEGKAGRLEALWERPGEARENLAGLVCHPHPLYGGTMHNKVVHHISMALQQLGLPVLRFNFRGASLSEGEHEGYPAGGRGEADDVRSALAWLGEKMPEARVVLGGFSFGAWVGMRVACEEPRVRALIGAGVPADNSDLSYLAGCAKPKLFLQGTRDPFGSRTNILAVASRMPEPRKLVFIEDADHFFTGHLEQLREEIVRNSSFVLGEDAEAKGTAAGRGA